MCFSKNDLIPGQSNRGKVDPFFGPHLVPEFLVMALTGHTHFAWHSGDCWVSGGLSV